MNSAWGAPASYIHHVLSEFDPKDTEFSMRDKTSWRVVEAAEGAPNCLNGREYRTQADRRTVKISVGQINAYNGTVLLIVYREAVSRRRKAWREQGAEITRSRAEREGGKDSSV